MHTLSHVDPGTYGLYGLTLQSDFPFVTPLPRVSGRPDIELTWEVEGRISRGATAARRPLYESPFVDERGRSVLSVYELAPIREWEFELPASGRFRVTAGSPYRIHGELRADVEPSVAEVPILGTLAAFVSEALGRPALHASAVEHAGCAIGFLAGNHAGKSTLASALMHRGLPLLTDDILPVAIDRAGGTVYPSFPQMRWDRATADHFAPGRSLAQVHPTIPKLRVPIGDGGFGRFTTLLDGLPLAVLYVPERVGEEATVGIEPAGGVQALIALLRHSYLARLVDALGMQERRMSVLGQLLRHTPVRILRYPHGWARLPEVVDRVVADVAALPREAAPCATPG